MKNKTSITYYPVFLNLKNKKAVVIGGGKVAERKVISLLKVCSDIKVISPHLTVRLEKEKQKGRIKHICRQYKKGDLKNAFLAIAATDSNAVNERAFNEAPCLINGVDMPSLCNFIVPSTVNRGDLTIAVSTSGISPGLSMTIRKELEKLYGAEFAVYLRLLKTIRAKALKMIPERKKRREFLKTIGSEKIVRLLREKGLRETKKILGKKDYLLQLW
ncbi:MAG: bifunctional precorrin-2 dehydrogenase/sirohydrochlorin ferrochelatase [Nitrospirota bacterium]